MAAQRNRQDQYLQKVGGIFYARVRVPRTLEAYVGQTHIRRSLETGDRAEANRRKHALVGTIKTELLGLRSAPTVSDPKQGISFAAARAWREAAKDGQDNSAATINKAEEVERLYGTAKAQRWLRAASPEGQTLSALIEQWLGLTDYRESTKAGHRKALADFLAYHRKASALPSDITRKVAIDYVDHKLTQQGLARSTILDRLASLSGLWQWMASRDLVSTGVNPWTGHKVSEKKNKGRSPAKRTFTEAELVSLLTGNDKVKRWPTYSYLPDLIVLGLFTGAREDELCSLLGADIELEDSHAVLFIRDAKTKAGIRYVGVTHPAPLAVLKRRKAGLKADGQLFPELSPGGIDDKLSASAVKAFGRYRRACGVPDGTDFHSFRRNVITVLENAGVGQVPIARFVGHRVGTMAGDTYSAGGSRENSIETARKVSHGATVGRALQAL